MPVLRTIDKNFFKVWNPNMAYVLGFFAADGNLMKNKRGACFFTLEICDEIILKKIQRVMGSDHKIGVRKSLVQSYKDRYRLQIGSKEIFQDLQRIGFETNKAHNMSVPNVPDEYFGDFLRGYFDGDGNIWLGKVHKERSTVKHGLLTAFTSSSRVFLQNLQKRIKKAGIEGGSLIDYDTYFRISYATKDSLKIYNLMYNGEHQNLYLTRKKGVYDRFVADKELRL